MIEVTNLNDRGPGSLREALTAKGPRTVVFRVSGTIELTSAIYVNNPSITVAGQTAPGEGILIKREGIVFKAREVIVRYIRHRAGLGTQVPYSGVCLAGGGPGSKNFTNGTEPDSPEVK